MRKLNNNEKKEAAHMLATLIVLMRVIGHLIIEAEKNANWLQRFCIPTRRMINLFCKASELMQKASGQLFYSIYHQIDNTQRYSVDFDDREIIKNHTDAKQFSLRMNLDSIDNEIKKLTDDVYHFITGGKNYDD